MSKADTIILNLGYLDTLARADSPVHRLDPRAKLPAVVLFIVTVVSFDKYTISAMLPFFLFPAAMIAVGDLPVGYLLKRLLWVAPFAVMVGIFNPILDRQVLFEIGSLHITGGWVSFASILLRFTLTVLAGFILIATTGFYAICLALEKIGVPNIFVMQLLFLYRYAFVLVGEAARIGRACKLRAPLRKATSIGTFVSLVGGLFLRTTDRAQRIYRAMCCRGFEGQIHLSARLCWTWKETLFLFGCGVVFIILRLTNPALVLGYLITGLFQ